MSERAFLDASPRSGRRRPRSSSPTGWMTTARRIERVHPHAMCAGEVPETTQRTGLEIRERHCSRARRRVAAPGRAAAATGVRGRGPWTRVPARLLESMDQPAYLLSLCSAAGVRSLFAAHPSRVEPHRHRTGTFPLLASGPNCGGSIAVAWQPFDKTKGDANGWRGRPRPCWRPVSADCGRCGSNWSVEGEEAPVARPAALLPGVAHRPDTLLADASFRGADPARLATAL